MTDLTSIAGLPPTWEQQQAEANVPGTEELGQQTFLKLLTTQLQNQDPLDPMKNEDFIAQLAQFSSLEELMGIQASLNSVYTGIAGRGNLYLGRHRSRRPARRGRQLHLYDHRQWRGWRGHRRDRAGGRRCR